MDTSKYKGRGAQTKSNNPFTTHNYVAEHIEGIDEPLVKAPVTEVIVGSPKRIINHIDSPDLGFSYSMNSYQGCEHGCVYCYARNSHHYWGYDAGLDFESKIVVKQAAASLLEKELLQPSWKAAPIALSGNTDCYQPLEKKYQLTRQVLKVMLKYRHPVGIITKNALIKRDIDILQDLAKLGLVNVFVSITTLDEKIRSVLEPRTASTNKKLEVIKRLSTVGIPVGVMNAPIIPGLNHHEMPSILEAAADHGALTAGYTVVRLNGAIGEIFTDWVTKYFPDRKDKILHLIAELHGGKINDSQWKRRMTGGGEMAAVIAQLFRIAKQQYFKNRQLPPLRTDLFRKGGHYALFS